MLEKSVFMSSKHLILINYETFYLVVIKESESCSDDFVIKVELFASSSMSIHIVSYF